jgi:predicted RNA-binding protein with PUA domain
MARLTSPRVVLLLEKPGTDELEEITVQTDNRDMVAYDLHRARSQWPKLDEAPILWMTFLGWHAMKRTGVTAEKFEDFNDRCAQVTGVDADGNALEPGDEHHGADPTPPAHAPA